MNSITYCNRPDWRLVGIVHYQDKLDNYKVSEAIFTKYDLATRRMPDGKEVGPFWIDTKEHTKVRFDVNKGETQKSFPNCYEAFIMPLAQKSYNEHLPTFQFGGIVVKVEYKVNARMHPLKGKSDPLI